MTAGRKRNRLKAGDFVIIGITAALAVFFSYRYFFSSYGGTRVDITAPSYRSSLPLDEDRVVEVPGPLGITEVVVEDGEVWVSESPCRQKICIKMGHKHRVGDQIVCIPNRVLVEVVGKKERIDGVAR